MKDIDNTGKTPATESNDNAPPRTQLRSVYAKTPLTQTVRAYLLEDDEANGLVASEFLKGYGFEEVVWRRSLVQAQSDLKALTEGEFDIVILDIMLPDGTAVSLLDQIKDAGCPCPVGLYTGQSKLEDQAFYDRHGCDFIFTKPLMADHFVDTLDALKKA